MKSSKQKANHSLIHFLLASEKM